jgi:hypothetical protein
MIVGAIDQETANARGSHLFEGNFLCTGDARHFPIEARSERIGNGVSNANQVGRKAAF